MSELAASPPYPVRFEVDYPEQQSRWKALLRVFLALPVVLFTYLLGGGATVALLAAILVRGRIPRWIFSFEVAVNQWQLRAASYFMLLTDEYPAFEGAYPVRYDASYPERSSRWRLVIWKFITSIPHLIVLWLLWLTLLVVMPVAWFAILFSGRFPQGLHTYVAGVVRWGARVQAYALSMTDEFPPFSLNADAGPSGRESYVISSVIGVLMTIVVVGGLTAVIILAEPNQERVDVPYEELITGQDLDTQIIIGDVLVTLPGASDQLFEPFDQIFYPEEEHRLVVFTVIMENYRDDDIDFEHDDLHLKDTGGDWHDPFVFLINGRTDGVRLEQGDGMGALVIFEIAEDEDPAELHINLNSRPNRWDEDYFPTLVYDFQP